VSGPTEHVVIDTLGDDGHNHVPILIDAHARDRLSTFLMRPDVPRGMGYSAFIERALNWAERQLDVCEDAGDDECLVHFGGYIRRRPRWDRLTATWRGSTEPRLAAGDFARGERARARPTEIFPPGNDIFGDFGGSTQNSRNVFLGEVRSRVRAVARSERRSGDPLERLSRSGPRSKVRFPSSFTGSSSASASVLPCCL
jgi:hypothetical protein